MIRCFKCETLSFGGDGLTYNKEKLPAVVGGQTEDTEFRPTRRAFVTYLLTSVSVASLGCQRSGGEDVELPITKNSIDNSSADKNSIPFKATDWEGLNPGYWKFEGGKLRRQVTAVGDRARRTGFPYHYESGWEPEGKMPRDYDPSLPLGIHWNRNQKLSEDFALTMEAEILANTSRQRENDDDGWDMYQSDFALIGLAFGGKTLFESFHPSSNASPLLVLKENGDFGFVRHNETSLASTSDEPLVKTDKVKVGETIKFEITVKNGVAKAELYRADVLTASASLSTCDLDMSGYVGVAARGLMDFEITSLAMSAAQETKLTVPQNDCHVCYALGDTLKETPNGWTVRFVSLFRTEGGAAEIRVADVSSPEQGWESVPAAGAAKIISNDFRDNTAIIDVTLPRNPAETTLYYTVWKDGENVTADQRPGTDAVGPGTGYVGDVPGGGDYVGRLPQLKAPYKIAGLSCHAIHTASKDDVSGPDIDRCSGKPFERQGQQFAVDRPFYVHDQPCRDAFKYIDDFNYQIMLWEDDIWYLELLIYPPSTADAYRQITLAIAGPTTRWQMMRHWNVMNPGDHDYGMDDVKGPEQLLLRNRDDLGQDPAYMARNFQIVEHLMSGVEVPSGTTNPKRWRKWKMPDNDFALIVTDARLWRTSQDTAIWDDEGWDNDATLYSRTDPTRTLLGEEQFAWFSQQIRTDSAPLICVTGMNALHTIWGGHLGDRWTDEVLERDRVSADYSGWVTAGANRVLDVLSSRTGIVSVYGDVHAGTIVRNKALNVFECSFGPIGRWGGRSLVKGFGRHMSDADGREIECVALYHHDYADPDLKPQEGIHYWNVLEAYFDPTQDDPEINLRIRNIADHPDDQARGGGSVSVVASQTGKPATSRVKAFTTLPNADILFLTDENVPVRGGRSNQTGRVAGMPLSGIKAGEKLTALARSGDASSTVILTTQRI